MKFTPWIIAVFAVAAVLYLQICRVPYRVNSANIAFEQLVKKQQDTISYYENLLAADSAAIGLAITQAEQSSERQLKAEADLLNSKSEVSILTSKLRAARKEKQDTNILNQPDHWVQVSPRYIGACDSLEIAADIQNAKIGSYITANNELKQKLVQEQEGYKVLLKHQQDFNLSLKHNFDSVKAVVKDLSDVKRTQVYAGINLLGNKKYFIDGGQITGTLLTKKNTMFEATVGLIHGEIYGGAGTKLLISFRKHR